MDAHLHIYGSVIVVKSVLRALFTAICTARQVFRYLSYLEGIKRCQAVPLQYFLLLNCVCILR